jgi:hypothetical protein
MNPSCSLGQVAVPKMTLQELHPAHVASGGAIRAHPETLSLVRKTEPVLASAKGASLVSFVEDLGWHMSSFHKRCPAAVNTLSCKHF